MALSDYKITENAVSTKGVIAAPDKLTGTANQNKMIFDRLIREAVKGLYNGLIDALAGAEGAAEIGLDAEGLDAETVAEGMAELAAELSTKAEAADVTAALALKADASALDAHTEDTGNPHSVSKNQVGLGNVDNTSDTDKPISTATQAALDGKQDALTFDTTPTTGSGNPVTSDGVKTALDAKLSKSGGTMTGAIAMGSNKITGLGTPTADADAATKQYVDDGLSAKQDALTFDTQPTANSTNPVTSGGVRTALDAKHDIFRCTYGTTTYAEIAAALAAGKLPVCAVYDEEEETSVVYPYTDSYNDMLDMATVYRFQLAYRDADGGVVIKGLKCRHNDEWDTFEASLQDKLTFDTTPTANSTKPVTSAGIKTALDGKQDTLTFDSAPTESSDNPVKSGGVYTALSGKQDTLTFDSTPTASSNNPVKSGGVKTYADGKIVYLDTREAASSAITALFNALAGKCAVYAVVHDIPHYIDYTLPLVSQALESYGFAAFVGSSDVQSVTAVLENTGGSWAWTTAINPS